MAVCMVGWSHSRFGRFPDRSLEEMIGEVAAEALADAESERSVPPDVVAALNTLIAQLAIS